MSGIDLTKQPAGTRIEAQTLNTLYVIEVVGDGTYKLMTRVVTDDSVSFEKFRAVKIPGSTWGGSALKRKWIGMEMCMEIIYLDPEDFAVTTPVQKLKIIAPDGSWSFDL